MCKKFIVNVIIIGFVFSIMGCSVYAYETEYYMSGKCYSNSINAYINGIYIDSWNINGTTYVDIEDLSKYGFLIEKCEELNSIRIIHDVIIDKSSMNYRAISKPLYFIYDDSDIKWTKPEFSYFAGMHGSRGEIIERGDKVEIQFNNRIKKEYVNAKYIPVYKDNMNVSYAFDYIYDYENAKVILKLKNNILSYCIDDKGKNAAKLDIYVLKEIETEEGSNLKYNYRLGSKILYKYDNLKKTEGTFIGNFNSNKKYKVVTVYKNTEHHGIWLNDKLLIRLEALGNVSWDKEKRIIQLETEEFTSQSKINLIENLYNNSIPLYKNNKNEWIDYVYPSMKLVNQTYIDGTQKYSNNNYLLDRGVEVVGSSNTDIIIRFKAGVNEEYLNSDYIKVYNEQQDCSKNFEYLYDPELKVLKLTLQNSPSKPNYSHAVYNSENKLVNLRLGERYNVYIMAGLYDKEDQVLDQTLRFSCNVFWNPDNEVSKDQSTIKEDKYTIVDSYDIDGETFIRTWFSDTIDEKYIFNTSHQIIKDGIEDDKLLQIRTSDLYCKTNVNDWIKEVSPSPSRVIRDNGNTIVLIDNIGRVLNIVFNKDINEDYINKDYITAKGYEGMFDYNYDKETKTLKMIFDPTNERWFNPDRPEAKVPAVFDIYLKKGLPSANGEKLAENIRITVALERTLLND